MRDTSCYLPRNRTGVCIDIVAGAIGSMTRVEVGTKIFTLLNSQHPNQREPTQPDAQHSKQVSPVRKPVSRPKGSIVLTAASLPKHQRRRITISPTHPKSCLETVGFSCLRAAVENSSRHHHLPSGTRGRTKNTQIVNIKLSETQI